MLVQTSSATFSPHSGSGPETGIVQVTFPSTVRQATVALTGFLVEFSGGNDHHYGKLQVQVQIPPGGIIANTVKVVVTFGLRDSSTTWFHHYDGTISFVVIAE